MENATMTDPAKSLGHLMVLILLIAIIYPRPDSSENETRKDDSCRFGQWQPQLRKRLRASHAYAVKNARNPE